MKRSIYSEKPDKVYILINIHHFPQILVFKLQIGRLTTTISEKEKGVPL